MERSKVVLYMRDKQMPLRAIETSLPRDRRTPKRDLVLPFVQCVAGEISPYSGQVPIRKETLGWTVLCGRACGVQLNSETAGHRQMKALLYPCVNGYVMQDLDISYLRNLP